MRCRKLDDKRGFTLVEMVVVMAILGIVMTAVMSLIIPTQRSATVQSSLTDVQGNLRIAMERTAKDFRNAGFMFNTDPDAGVTAVAGYANDTTTQGETVTVDASAADIVINTRAVSGRFGRIQDFDPLNAGTMQLVYAHQARYFSPGDYVAVGEPVTGGLLPADTIFSVLASDPATGEVQIGTAGGAVLANNTAFAGNSAGLILYLAPSTVVGDLDRTITYRHEDGDGDGLPDTLTRQIDGGQKQFLARNVTSAQFEINEDADGDISKVIITLAGTTVAAGGNEIVGQAKTRTLSTVVSLRNF